MKKSLIIDLERARRRDFASSWKLTYQTFQPAKEALREALCTLGNGYFGTRGAAPEAAADRIHYPGTYFAGVYDKLPTHIAGRTVYNEDFVNCPNWLPLHLRAGTGPWIVPSSAAILTYYQGLNMRNGALTRRIRLRDGGGHVFDIETRRIVSMDNRHLAAVRYAFTPEDYEGVVTVRSGLDGNVLNAGVARYRQLNAKHLRSDAQGMIDDQGVYLSVRTAESQIRIAEACCTRFFVGKQEVTPESHLVHKGSRGIYQDFRLHVRRGEEVVVEKVVALYTSRDTHIPNPLLAAVEAVRKRPRFFALYAPHKKAWHRLWKRCDIRIEGDVTYRRILRLHIFHLLQTASPHNVSIDASVPARGLHGEAYRGHIFWDNLFVMPFYNWHAPEISKALLMYRYRRLEQARRDAAKEGYHGAMFPWQSSARGDEQTQIVHLNPMSGKWGPDHSHLQRHVSFAVAYNVWRYWKDTGDTAFMEKCGAEMMLSVAQFGASLCSFEEEDGRYHTDGLMGPDEFHEKLPNASRPGFRDNAYSNLMIVATLTDAIEALHALPAHRQQELRRRLDIDEAALGHWRDITRRMHIPMNKDGIIGQFEGYFGLKELNWEAYRKKYGNIQRLDRILKAEGKSPNAYKVAKQADALMIFYLFSQRKIAALLSRLGLRYDADMLRRNYDYYVRRTSHGSTLSKVVHCHLANVLGRETEAWEWFLEVLKSDIYDTQGGTTPEGIHTGVMGGSLYIAMKCFAGLELFDERIALSPSLPRDWREVRFRFLYKGRWIALLINRRQIFIYIQGPRNRPYPLAFEVYGRPHRFVTGKIHKISLRRGRLGAVAGAAPHGEQERILIVDGDIMRATNLKTRLEAIGYLTECVHSGAEARAVLKSGWVDLIVMSVVLRGGMSGYQLLREVRASRSFGRVPVIVQTRKTGMRGVFERLGATAFLVPPYPLQRTLRL
ncbi:MAG: response regulator, partial [Deltaproteobacteria bacterium]